MKLVRSRSHTLEEESAPVRAFLGSPRHRHRVAAAALMLSAACAKAPTPLATPTNLLLVTVDTVRADHLGCYDGAGAGTPNLDRLAGQGARFADAVSPVPLTLPAHASILSGLLPPHHGVRNNGGGRFPDEPATLATRLGAAGYRTGAFVGAFVLDRRFGLTRGFERYDDDISREAKAAAGLDAERPGSEVVDRALAWLADNDPRPFFAWVHLYDAHAPYQPPEPFRTRFRDRPYDGEIAEVDHQIGRLLESLSSRSLEPTTVVAVVGDHGESLGEHGEMTHGLLLYEPALRVPWIIRGPGVARGAVVANTVSLTDVAPTLAGLLGAPLTGGAIDGRDLSAALRSRAEPEDADAYAETRYPTSFGWAPLAAVRRGHLKLIAAPSPELYDLATDPNEQHDLASSRPADVTSLSARLAGLASGERAAPAAAVDAEARARLQSLGYLGGSSNARSQGAAANPRDRVMLFREFEAAHWALVAGRTGEATTAMERLVAQDPANPVFVGQLAEAQRRARRYDRAIALYRRAVELAPDDRDARYNLAVTLQEAGRLDDAVTALETAIWLDPARPEAHNALGIALVSRGDLEGAAAQFRKSTEVDAHDARAFNNLGNVLRDLKRFDEGESAYRRAIELEPAYADPLNGLGTLEVQRGRPAAAVALFDRVLSLAPQLHEARLNRAIALDLAGDRQGAIAGYRDFLRSSTGDPQFEQQRRAARRLLGRLTAAGSGT